MAEHLPLIPDKGEAVCSDVRPVLREVFKDYDCLPPLDTERRQAALPGAVGDSNLILPQVNQWIDKYNSDRKEISKNENELQHKYAERMLRKPLRNIYKLYPSQEQDTKVSSWEAQRGILERRDLIPTITENANVKNVLWVQNTLNRSSANVSEIEVKCSKIHAPIHLDSATENTLQSISIGEVVPHSKPSSILSPNTDSQTPGFPRSQGCIISVPLQIEFINYTVGALHSQNLRLVNVSSSEVRLSVRPPSSPELKIELGGTRGLTVTSGSAAEIRVHFRPQRVHVVHDAILVRVSTGASFTVPISCYMQPPLLQILIPAVNLSILSSTPGMDANISRSTDCLELGTRLLGDVHHVTVLFYCEAEHAAFLLLTEDAWLEFNLDAVSPRGSVVAPPFALSPALWRGGGAARGSAWCRAGGAGLLAAALRLLSSTAVVRPLHLIADSIHFSAKHISLEAHEKKYDICSEDDPACEYYVHLGTAFPHRSLSATVQLVNHSPVVYSYYWSVRPWGACSCWENYQESDSSHGSVYSDDLCVGAKQARDRETMQGPGGGAGGVRAEGARGAASPRAACAVRVCVPDVGAELHTQRAVLMLVLKDIPRESLLKDDESRIIKKEIIQSDPIPGVQAWTREVCEVVCTQMEVWWEVAPVRFVVDPPVIHLNYSRRVTSVNIPIRATQLFGCESIHCRWQVPAHVSAPSARPLTPATSCDHTLHYSFPSLPNAFPEIDVLTLRAAHDEWQAQCSIRRRASARPAVLRPPRVWLGAVPPGTHVQATLHILNDTYQDICWYAEAYRWCGDGERGLRAACARRPCVPCRDRTCACRALRPPRGSLPHAHRANILYDVHAPTHEGVVCTLVSARVTGADGARVEGGAGSAGRAVLVSYRVVAPRLLLRVLPCCGDHHGDCEGCALGSAEAGVVRPQRALTLGGRGCCRLRLTNLTPVPTAVTWEPAPEEDVLKVFFIPNQLDVGSHAQVEMKVVLEARRVCGRRIYIRRAAVKHAKYIYLVIDTAIAGIEISCEVPLGGGEKTDSILIMRRTQKELFPRDADKPVPRTPHEIFADEDRKRATVTENICHCKINLEYVEPKKMPRPPSNGDNDPPVEIVTEPPSKTRLCPCFTSAKPIIVEPEEACCLQFHKLPLRTVRSRTITIRNESVLSASWTTAVRNWPKHRHRTLSDIINPDKWRCSGSSPGVALQCWPSSGVLGARGREGVRVDVYADAWGLFRDQVLINIENLDGIVIDVWIEAVGSPLQFALNLVDDTKLPVLCFMSSTDPERKLRVKNVSRTDLLLHTYTLTQHGHPQDALPFRLYWRFVDIAPVSCPPCDRDCEEQEENSTISVASTHEERLYCTGIELYLAPDYGIQDDSYFKVSPESLSVRVGSWAPVSATLRAPAHRETAPHAALLLRAVPLLRSGECWYRPDPAPLLVQLRHTEREGRLKLSCQEICIKICALNLPFDSVMRIRKPFRIQNVGNGQLEVSATTSAPWSVVIDDQHRRQDSCKCTLRNNVKQRQLSLSLMPRSSLEVSAEVEVRTEEAWPPAGAPHPPAVRRTTLLTIYDDDNVLQKLPLTLELEYPKITIEPAMIDFGFVTDGDTRKSYFSVIHSSRTESLNLVTEWVGGDEFRLWPKTFTLKPGAREIIYIQYTARWRGAPVEGAVRVGVAGAGARCGAGARARAAPARDHTGDTHLLPPPPRL